jgi:hypothetical protein
MTDFDSGLDTWWYFGRKWVSYEELSKRFQFDIRDLAMDIKLSD